ncbi:Transcriptional regulator, GntR family [Pseudonocardia sp. Ae406_Ps2]|uniref:GntR family transcriptional regulator n=1 Tax=unclassified Pseudonocardia TaxID=2619320 RepID=UPI00094B5264|nr:MULTISPECIES: GntR family transcriptional regulator [unclassified Pseudonocardia]OLL87020.1 Transcriptional regulator, GntR family [Pseudonocardia sp. Ae263_Ps1]OLM01615.1 Transcriptional regulator, GntR family [Pseudonocardia sp. Ae406_Ps2]OLM23186.1 Transcriptional regulator, GntR family [Pseudonocardia sp. Ae706_Ps2]OLM29136.1 hypothetical protein Ae717Ps2_0028 [Pseudonocardia sp. Ae717_Ps2]OLM32247.1 hypothetical protein Ae717Ps2_3142 [Pseudonocardia sp. Ae717_Ps2]
MAIDQRSDRPVFAQVADVLRQRIRSGELGPGAKLPSEAELMSELGVTRQTIRRGLAVLQQEGLTEPIHGKGTFVRQALPVLAMRNNRFSRAARAQGKGALAAEAEALGLEWTSEELGPVETVDVSADVAELIGEPTAVVKRRRMWVGGSPTQLADSYIPSSLDAEIGFSAGETAPGGIYGLLEAKGHAIAEFQEELFARQASPEEAVALHLASGAPVVSLVRQALDKDGRVLEYFDSVAVGDRHRYVYRFAAE